MREPHDRYATTLHVHNLSFLKSKSIQVAMISLTLLNASSVLAANVEDIEAGRRIYQEGILSSGQSLVGQRSGPGEVEGKIAACINCHRKSGMGSLEGNIEIPPVTGRFLFATEDRPIALLDARAAKNITRPRASYSEEALAKSIREGIKVDGSPMDSLMPRYALNDQDLKALSAYLHQLSIELSPGVKEDSLKIATIIAPGVDIKKKTVMLEMMRAAFNQRNASQQNISGRMRSPIDAIPHTLRNWQLIVWELQGTPDTWEAQLSEFNRKDPVFAVISGLSNDTWAPIDQFCEHEQLPCVLPSTRLPATSPGYYSLYFSKGVMLEAEVLSKHFQDLANKAPKRLVQIYRKDNVSQSAAQSLTQALKGQQITIEDRIVADQSNSDLTRLFAGLKPTDALMLWLNPVDLITLSKAAPKKLAPNIYASAIMIDGQSQNIPELWHAKLQLIYPYELGQKRQTNTNNLTNWLKTWQLPNLDPIFQSEVFFNLLLLTDLTSQMLDNLYRDYLIERAEDMLSWGANVSAYPHLSLAPGQRFASKGAYIARFNKDGTLSPETPWLVP